LAPVYYRDADGKRCIFEEELMRKIGAVLVYDITIKQTFEKVKEDFEESSQKKFCLGA